MKGIRVWVLAAGLLTGLSTRCAEEAVNPMPENTTTHLHRACPSPVQWSIPDMDEEEQKALAELVPVYQSNRAKRLAYEVRRKHARVELHRLSRRFREEHKARNTDLNVV